MTKKLNSGILTEKGSRLLYGNTSQVGEWVHFELTRTKIARKVYKHPDGLFLIGEHISYGDDINEYEILFTSVMERNQH